MVYFDIDWLSCINKCYPDMKRHVLMLGDLLFEELCEN